MFKRRGFLNVRMGFLCLLALGFSSLLMAQSSPTTMNYQGRLTDNTPGQDPIDTTVSITFTIHDHATNASPVWTESWPTVSVNNGIFSVLLGSNGTALPDSVFSATTTLYLELIINGETLAPRQQLGSVGFSQVAVNADLAASTADLNCTDCVESGEVNFNYAGSASEGGAATDLDCVDCVSDAEASDVLSIDNSLLTAIDGETVVTIGTAPLTSGGILEVDGTPVGVYGQGNGSGVWGNGDGSNGAIGVLGTGGGSPPSGPTGTIGVEGANAYTGVKGTGYDFGVHGLANGAGTRHGVYGDGGGANGSAYGVYGTNADYGVAGFGAEAGVYGQGEDTGVWGTSTGSGSRYGIVGDGGGWSGDSYGLWGQYANTGVRGNGFSVGVDGLASGTGTRYGVRGDGNGTTGTSYAGHFSNADIGVYGTGSSQAGYFSGEVYITRNSSSSQPHLELYESGSGDYARIKFRQSGSTEFFDIAASPNNTGSSGWLNFFSSAYGDTLRIRGDGYVYITRLGSYSNTLCVSSTGGGYIGNCSSSGQYKTNIHPLALGLETVLKLNPVLFDWKEDGSADLGFVAEEVADIDPVLTTTNADGGPEGVRYRQLTAVLTNAIQEQQALIEKQQTLLEELTRRVAELEAE